MLGLSGTLREHSPAACVVTLRGGSVPSLAQGFPVSVEPPCSTDLVARLVTLGTRQCQWAVQEVLVD